jgi:AcrR family transcriptional regulator
VPRETLTREQVVTVAIELLDTEGLEGFNMRDLGERLDSAATAVYWHVGSKANLIALACDHVWNEVELPDLTDVDWRTAATSMAAGMRAMLARHPWLVRALGAHVVYGPGKARYDDHGLAVYEAAGLTGAQADQAAAAVFMFVLGCALAPAAQASLAKRLGSDRRNAKAAMREAMTRAAEVARRFPHLIKRLETAAAAEYAAAPDSSFEFGLDAILDGIETKLRAHRTKGKTRGHP